LFFRARAEHAGSIEASMFGLIVMTKRKYFAERKNLQNEAASLRNDLALARYSAAQVLSALRRSNESCMAMNRTAVETLGLLSKISVPPGRHYSDEDLKNLGDMG
jgi:hypothetical protein